MQGREIFGALVRILGIWFLYLAAYDAIFLALRLSDALQRIAPQTTSDKIFLGFHVLLAFVLLTGADRLVRLFYGPASLA